MVGWIANLIELFVCREAPSRRLGKRVWAGFAQVERSAQSQRCVAQSFSIEPTAVEPPVPGIAWVLFGTHRIHLGRELIRLRQHDLPMHCLEGPPGSDELVAQPVE